MKLVFVFIVLIFYFLNAFSQINIYPKTYYAYKTIDSVIIDGIDSEKSWKLADKSSDFVNIDGDSNKAPYYNTYVKILWDSNYLYFFAELKGNHIWATLTERESIIFYDNDFEIFIDPDGDNHNYYEFEFNAFSTEWDLLLTKPYRDGGVALFSWTCSQMKSATNINGSINNPSDIDSSWSIEIAIPLDCLKDALKPRKKPKADDVYRLNFSRVQWEIVVEDGKYKKLDKDEHNWVWSPQFAINMHRPEYWGYLVFSGDNLYSKSKENYVDDDFGTKMKLMKLYYAQNVYFKNHNRYSVNIDNLNLEFDYSEVKLISNGKQYIATYKNWNVNHNSRLWVD